MYFSLSKILWWIISPFNIIILLLFLGWILLFRKPHIGKKLISIGLLLLLIICLDFFPVFLIGLLENGISAGQIPDRVKGIIVLAGMVDMEASRQGSIELTEQADRIISGVILAREHPEAKLIITGGSGVINQEENLREADYLKSLALSLGIRNERIIIERNSRNTHEHAVELAKLLQNDGQWVLVTSAFHMPRSYGCFIKEGFNIIPYPVDYKTKSDRYKRLSLTSFLPRLGNITRFSIALHEWLGLAAYRFIGYIDSFFPSTEEWRNNSESPLSQPSL